ncbi:transcriptional regulator, GntR family [Paenibacillus curdlanolyticus YK9]|uniref:Transcriptional regulator, GntR family n=1 Tax=Paenibacillus curdlanolyticus YK9 TaxID=717606 RepID=E0I8U5_9BACL|nr:GntR family transcriptional regulator [Paenibacillus curdlanolyticus]EFM10829.1 transcriptional regulator, GntR family [Paenibacillus curdlanolyticus YK9]
MIIRIDLESDTPIYNQLTNQIMEGIATGELKPGQALPSVRALASDLGINLHTVNKAYSILKDSGFVQIHRQKGAVVQAGGMPPADLAFEERLERELRPMAAEAVGRGMTEERWLALCRQAFEQLHARREGGTI